MAVGHRRVSLEFLRCILYGLILLLQLLYTPITMVIEYQEVYIINIYTRRE